MTTYTNDVSKVSDVLEQNDIALVEFDQNISHDNGLSSMYYNEFINGYDGFEKLQYHYTGGNYGTAFLVILGENMTSDDKHFSEDELAAMTTNDLMALALELDCGQSYIDENGNTKPDEAIDDLLQLSHKDYYDKHFQNNRYCDLDYDFTVTGYSQGDGFKVVCLGNAKDIYQGDALTNIFYDSPISGNVEVTINGDSVAEIEVSEHLDDQYNWDKEAFITSVSKAYANEGYHDLLIDFLKDNLDKSLDYTG